MYILSFYIFTSKIVGSVTLLESSLAATKELKEESYLSPALQKLSEISSNYWCPEAVDKDFIR